MLHITPVCMYGIAVGLGFLRSVWLGSAVRSFSVSLLMDYTASYLCLYGSRNFCC